MPAEVLIYVCSLGHVTDEDVTPGKDPTRSYTPHLECRRMVWNAVWNAVRGPGVDGDGQLIHATHERCRRHVDLLSSHPLLESTFILGGEEAVMAFLRERDKRVVRP